MSSSERESAFWAFSCSLYKQPGVEAALLRLQRRHGVNVNVVLFGCWLAITGVRAWRASQVQACLRRVHRWHDKIVLQLRCLRASVKQCVGRDALYNALSQQELYAEQVEQGLLLANFHDYTRAATAGTTRTLLQRVCQNIATYFAASHVRFSPRNQADCLLLVQALFPRVTAAVLTRTCQEVWCKGHKQRKPRQMLLSFPLYGN